MKLSFGNIVITLITQIIGSLIAIYSSVRISRWETKNRDILLHLNDMKENVLKPWLRKIENNPKFTGILIPSEAEIDDKFKSINPELFQDMLCHFSKLKMAFMRKESLENELNVVKSNLLQEMRKNFPKLVIYDHIFNYILSPTEEEYAPKHINDDSLVNNYGDKIYCRGEDINLFKEYLIRICEEKGEQPRSLRKELNIVEKDIITKIRKILLLTPSKLSQKCKYI